MEPATGHQPAALPPFAIGGLGGSGTRAVAAVARRLGAYMGADLNRALDNLWFTLLFKRPVWFEQAQPDSIHDGLRLFEKLMAAGGPPSARELRFLMAAAADSIRNERRGWRWVGRRLVSIARASAAGRSRWWGWKEPNAHFYLRSISEVIPNIRYIHVIRNGLDMAFSRNRTQFAEWGAVHRDRAVNPSVTPVALLRFWLDANESAIRTGGEVLSERFLVVRFDDLASGPSEEIPRIAEFLGVTVDEADLAALREEVGSPTGIGRFRHEDLSTFSKRDLDAVAALGFEVT